MNYFEICIIGAGPAGSSIACKLKRLGFQVLLIGQEFAGESMAETLSPAVVELLEAIGLQLDPEKADITGLDQTIQIWKDQRIHAEKPKGWLVRRGKFDRHLLSVTGESGVEIMQPAKVVAIAEAGGHWEIQVMHQGNYIKVKAGFLVDASGKKSVLRGTKKRVACSTLALSCEWKNTGYYKHCTMLEAAPSHWLWGAMLPNGIFVSTVFQDPDLDLLRSGQLMNHYISAIKGSRLFRHCLKGEPAGKISAFDATPYYYEKPAGLNFMKVGEANFGLDPISSQGVQSAISNAIQGSIVINTILKEPAKTGDALEFYKFRQQEIMSNHIELSKGSYGDAIPYREELFWRKRMENKPVTETFPARESGLSALSRQVQFSAESMLSPTLCIVNDQITRRIGLKHSGLKSPLVFWENKQIDLILGNLKGIYTASDLINKWAKTITVKSSLKLFHSLSDAKVLVTAK